MNITKKTDNNDMKQWIGIIISICFIVGFIWDTMRDDSTLRFVKYGIHLQKHSTIKEIYNNDNDSLYKLEYSKKNIQQIIEENHLNTMNKEEVLSIIDNIFIKSLNEEEKSLLQKSITSDILEDANNYYVYFGEYYTVQDIQKHIEGHMLIVDTKNNTIYELNG